MKNLIGEVNWVSDQDLASKKVNEMKEEEKEVKVDNTKEINKKVKEIITLKNKLQVKLEELYEINPEKSVYDSIISLNMLNNSLDD